MNTAAAHRQRRKSWVGILPTVDKRPVGHEEKILDPIRRCVYDQSVTCRPQVVKIRPVEGRYRDVFLPPVERLIRQAPVLIARSHRCGGPGKDGPPDPGRR